MGPSSFSWRNEMNMEHKKFVATGHADELRAAVPQSGAERLFSIDYREIWAAIYRSRFIVGGILAGCFAIAILFTLLTTPIYKATATVQIDQETAKVLGTEQDNPAALGAMDTQRFLNTQIEVLNSRGVATMVANDLKLFNNPDFLQTMGLDPDVEPPVGMKPDEYNRLLVLGLLDRNLEVAIERDSRIARIEFASPDASLAARIANSFADNFIRNNLKRKFDTSGYARDFLREQLDQAQVRLERTERALVQFSSSTRIVDASSGAMGGAGSAPKSLLTASLIAANNELSEATARRIEAEQRWDGAKNTPVLSLPEVLTNQAVQQLFQERAIAKAEYEEQLQRRRSDYPLVQQAKAKVDEIDQQLRTLTTGIRNSIHNQYKISLDQERAITVELQKLKGDTLREQRQGIQMSVLQREADTARQQFEALLRRYNQLNAEAGIQTNNISIIDRAVMPSNPAWPNVLLNFALALVASAVLSAIFIFLREQILERVRTPDDISHRLSMPLLGVIPKIDDNVIESLGDAKTEISEAFNSVRTSIALSSKDGLPKTMTFVSTAKGEGKSTACYATAVGLGKLGKRVVVLDLDLRLPTQHKLHDLPNDHGMSEVLTSEAFDDSVVLQTSHANVSLVPSGPLPPSPTELLGTERLGQFIDHLLARFDIVLIDSPPVLGLADALLIASRVEATVYIVRSSVHSSKGVQAALRRLRQASVHVAGIVLTYFDAGGAGYGYSYGYGYAQSYTYGSR